MAGGERPAESESTDAESYEFMAGEVTALADERAHHRFGITVGPRPRFPAVRGLVTSSQCSITMQPSPSVSTVKP
jgi:hypothetical protein